LSFITCRKGREKGGRSGGKRKGGNRIRMPSRKKKLSLNASTKSKKKGGKPQKVSAGSVRKKKGGFAIEKTGEEPGAFYASALGERKKGKKKKKSPPHIAMQRERHSVTREKKKDGLFDQNPFDRRGKKKKREKIARVREALGRRLKVAVKKNGKRWAAGGKKGG